MGCVDAVHEHEHAVQFTCANVFPFMCILTQDCIYIVCIYTCTHTHVHILAVVDYHSTETLLPSQAQTKPFTQS